MTTLRKFVSELTDTERHAVLESYAQFEIDGMIGDAPIRTQARNFIQSIGITGEGKITLWMEKLAMECYRYYYTENTK